MQLLSTVLLVCVCMLVLPTTLTHACGNPVMLDASATGRALKRAEKLMQQGQLDAACRKVSRAVTVSWRAQTSPIPFHPNVEAHNAGDTHFVAPRLTTRARRSNARAKMRGTIYSNFAVHLRRRGVRLLAACVVRQKMPPRVLQEPRGNARRQTRMQKSDLQAWALAALRAGAKRDERPRSQALAAEAELRFGNAHGTAIQTLKELNEADVMPDGFGYRALAAALPEQDPLRDRLTEKCAALLGRQACRLP